MNKERKTEKNQHWLPALSLLLLAPVFGEILSTSSPPLEFLSPPVFIILVGLYGCGALLAREVARRWKKGWVSILLLGMAYGIYEEGIVVRSFFDPNWVDIGALGSYGRAWGINFIWSISLTLFHAVVSIGLPILLVEMTFPKVKDDVWLGKGGMVICGVVFASFLFLAPLLKLYTITWMEFALCMICMGLLVWAAKQWNGIPFAIKAQRVGTAWQIGLSYFGLMVVHILGTWLLPEMRVPVGVTFAVLAVLPWVGVWLAKRWNSAAWDERQQWAAGMGLVTPWLILSVVAELQNATRPDDTRGMALAAILVLMYLVVLRIRIERRGKRQERWNRNC